ncbi:Hypothetical predicted protein, partial [Olea europaea subsp. europaea]
AELALGERHGKHASSADFAVAAGPSSGTYIDNQKKSRRKMENCFDVLELFLFKISFAICKPLFCPASEAVIVNPTGSEQLNTNVVTVVATGEPDAGLFVSTRPPLSSGFSFLSPTVT